MTMYRARGMAVSGAHKDPRGRGGARVTWKRARIAVAAAALVAVPASLGCEFVTGPLDELETDEATQSSGPPRGSSGGNTSTGVVTSPPETDTSSLTEPPSGESSTGLGSDTAGGPQSCCEAGPFGGCEDSMVESCVCGADPACCEVRWTASCAAAVDALGCGFCAPAPPDNLGPCCEVGEEGHIGCADPQVEACVCAKDDFCCEEEWDELCADAVPLTGCGECEPKFGPSCCFPQPGPTCEESDVKSCVCEYDAYCCMVQWDAACVASVERLGCGPCDGGPGTTGTGSTGTSSSGGPPTAGM